MSGCHYCEEGEGSDLITYAQTVKPMLAQLLSNHQRRVEAGENEALSALSVVNGLLLIQGVTIGGNNG
jgi:hypothetical protein